MPPLVIPGVPVRERRHSRVLQSSLAAPRQGVMLHYDDSTRDDWALAWFSDPRCTNGYTWLVLHDGSVIELADPALRTPHAGACLTPNANSRFYGLSAATDGLIPATSAQMRAITATCVALFRFHGWTLNSFDAGGLVGHDAEAIWTPATTRAAGLTDERGIALWGKTGRKVDPTGVRRDGQSIIDIGKVRRSVAAALNVPREAVHDE
ncbi:MAG TPA: N-acetylmuramoyl-L-alanine amidase [Gemmatimonadaceae bacterium]|nr:N-acetylmuramoyl-L-alanine amidase [Gemmatimonadaceae bacterium]